ncbi:MAG: hypothetical protein Q4A25_01530 [Candidatus Saccharibacteria bacterium]|nr:hypothetical protein [Candidatus Saccharibacteria bacterium]
MANIMQSIKTRKTIYFLGSILVLLCALIVWNIVSTKETPQSPTPVNAVEKPTTGKPTGNKKTVEENQTTKDNATTEDSSQTTESVPSQTHEVIEIVRTESTNQVKEPSGSVKEENPKQSEPKPAENDEKLPNNERTETGKTTTETEPAKTDNEIAKKLAEAARAAGVRASTTYTDTYPYAKDCPEINWRYTGEVKTAYGGSLCETTSYVGWKVHEYWSYSIPWAANAKDWGYYATAYGLRFDSNPAPYTVGVQYIGAWGHVVWVEQVNNDGTVDISEYNNTYSSGNTPNSYGYQTSVPASTYYYIHFD